MNFDFSAEQRELQQQVRRLLSDHCSRDAVRKVVDGREPFLRDAWMEMGALGYLGAAIPEAFGGSGFGHLELCIVAEEVGRVLAPLPFDSSICQAAELVSAFGFAAQKREWLPKLATGEAIACVAYPGSMDDERAAPRFERGELTGKCPDVTNGSFADLAVVFIEGKARPLLVDLRQTAVKRHPVGSIDLTRTRATLTFEGAKAELIGTPNGEDALRWLLDRAVILTAFEQIGGAQRCLEMARDYALTRYAFGRTVASYQAIKHKLVDVYAQLRLATAHAYYGAWALSTDSDQLSLAAASARVTASEAFNFAAQENIQVHGGIGFSWEHDCHLYYRRARMQSIELGVAHEWRDRVTSIIEKANGNVGVAA